MFEVTVLNRMTDEVCAVIDYSRNTFDCIVGSQVDVIKEFFTKSYPIKLSIDRNGKTGVYNNSIQPGDEEYVLVAVISKMDKYRIVFGAHYHDRVKA